MGSTVLKLEGTGGDLKEMTTTEENYLAYRAGLSLAEMVDSASSLVTSSSGATSIGSYSDNVYDQAVGSHGTLTTTTTTTTLYQKDGIADSSGGDFHLPLEFIDNSGDFEIHELTQSEVDTLTDRLVSRIMTSEYPGTYRLGSSAPSGDYNTHLSSVFTDTRTDGTSVAYSIYQRQSMSAPTTVRPVSVKRASGRTGSFQGIQEMTDGEIKYTFGQEAKTRIVEGTDGVGTYQLRSSAQGAPTASGTWNARGTATDTKNTVVETDYTRTAEEVYTGNFIGDFIGDFSRTFTGNFIGNFQQEYTGNYTGDFLRDFTGNFLRDFTGNFLRDFTGNFARDFTGDFVREFTGTFAGNFTGNFLRGTSQVTLWDLQTRQQIQQTTLQTILLRPHKFRLLQTLQQIQL